MVNLDSPPEWPIWPREAEEKKLLAQPFLTINQAATILGVSRWTIMRMVQEGRLSGQKAGRSKLIPTGQVQQLKTNKRSKSSGIGRFVELSDAQAHEIAKALATVLAEGFMPVSPGELIEIVRGHEHPGPVFWSSLVAGIERLRSTGRATLAPIRSG